MNCSDERAGLDVQKRFREIYPGEVTLDILRATDRVVFILMFDQLLISDLHSSANIRSVYVFSTLDRIVWKHAVRLNNSIWAGENIDNLYVNAVLMLLVTSFSSGEDSLMLISPSTSL